MPLELRQTLHAEFLANEQAYWQMRDSLIETYGGQWVGIRAGKIVASGRNVTEVLAAAAEGDGHPYVALVGNEDIVFRSRHSVFHYDATYQLFSMPRMTATFCDHSVSRPQTYPDVIPDTGSDVCVLPDRDCAAIGLYTSPSIQAMSGGIHGLGQKATVYLGKVEIDGRRFKGLIQPTPTGSERIVGREILNYHRVLFDGPVGQVVIDP